MRIVIVGAGYAGLFCALRLARLARGRAEVTLISGSATFVERIRLHEQAAGSPARRLSLPTMVTGSDVKLRIGWVHQIDLTARTLLVDTDTIPFDRLVLATGSHTDLTRVPGAAEHAYSLDAGSLAWLTPLVSTIAARNGRLVVVGGGLTGIEAATELRELHPSLSVTLATRGEVAAGFAVSTRAHVRKALARLGVSLAEGVDVRAIESHAVVTNGGSIGFDACIWASGFRAAPLARESGLSTNVLDQVEVDASLRSISHPFVYVAGDLAAPSESVGDPLPMGCKSAFPMALQVAENLARVLDGEPERPLAFRLSFYCISLGRHDGVIEPASAQRGGGRIVKGKVGARLKELVCRGTLWFLELERKRAALARVLRVRKKPLLPAATAERAA